MSHPSASITRVSGDTWEELFTIKDSHGNVIDITGYTFEMKVGPRPRENATPPLYTVSGTIVSAPQGTVKFSPSALQTAQTPDEYYYVIIMTDNNGKTRTSAINQYVYNPNFG